MKRILTAAVLAAALVALAMTTTGCTRVRLAENPDTRTTSETKTVAIGDAKSVEAEVRMGVGELTMSVEPTTSDLLRAGFTYAPVSWKPTVTYDVSSGVGRLLVAQPDSSGVPAFGGAKNTWDLKLDGGVPTRLKLVLGVGTSRIDLRGLDLTSLDAVTGVGDTTIDLSGPRTTDLAGRIQAGVGNIVVRLPKNVGVRVSGRQDGVGSFNAEGFTAQGDYWVNDAYSDPGPKIDIQFERGVGDATLVLVDQP
jgi:hypothetical protein